MRTQSLPTAATPSVQSADSRRRWLLAPWFALAAVLLLGGMVRFQALARQSLWIDEGFSVVHAQAIARHGYPRLPCGDVSWSYFPAHYAMALGMAATGHRELGARLPAALAGFLLLAALYAVAARLFRSRWQGVGAAALLAFCAYEVAWSRQARGYTLLQLFVVLACGAWLAFLDLRTRRHLAGAVVWSLLAMASHRAGYLAVAVVGVSVLFELRRARSWTAWLRARRFFVFAVAMGAASALAVLSMLASNSAPTVVAGEAHGVAHGSWYLRNYLLFLARQYGGFVVWALIGATVAVRRNPTRVLPLLVAAAAYLWMLSYRTVLFHLRYILPVLWLIPLFAAHGLFETVAACRRWARGRTAGYLGVAAVAAASLHSARWTLWPTAEAALDFTAPQPDWRAAFAWVATDAQAGRERVPEITTASTFPMFHDFFLGAGRKRFLPYSRSGFPGEYQNAPRYSEAEGVSSLDDFLTLEAYVVLDEFGLRMLRDAPLRALLMRTPPDHVVRSPQGFHVFIWRPRPAVRPGTAPSPAPAPPAGVRTP